MDVILHSIKKRPETGEFDLSIAVGSESAKSYRAFYEDINSKSNFCKIDGDILKRLGDLSLQRYHIRPKYGVELVGIIRAFSHGDFVPQMPATLGTTSSFPHVLNKQGDASEA